MLVRSQNLYATLVLSQRARATGGNFYSASQARACSNSLGRKNFTGARRTPAPAKPSACTSHRGSATMAIFAILSLCEKRKSRSFQSAPRSHPSKFSSRMASRRGSVPASIFCANSFCPVPKLGALPCAAHAQNTDVVRLIIDRGCHVIVRIVTVSMTPVLLDVGLTPARRVPETVIRCKIRRTSAIASRFAPHNDPTAR